MQEKPVEIATPAFAPVEEVDVLICGSGSAGLCAAVWLARTGINYRMLERRSGPLKHGQADGVQCRTVEVMESFGLSEPVLREAYHVLEVAFWGDDGNGGISRGSVAPDTQIGLTHLPHVILSQGRMNDLMIKETIRVGGESRIRYDCEVKDVQVDQATANDPNAHCVTVTALQDGVERQYRAKYVLGCDGAHSQVRKSLGFKMVGDSTDAVWAVMDIHPKTNFPDIRKKSILHSKAGNIMIIPREGDSMVRFYLELPGAKVASDVKLENLIPTIQDIFHPYTMEIAETVWFSAYLIGQRRADYFTQNNRVFLTGDACHTHSPKAGQGMNVSLQDGYNIGWKLAGVLKGEFRPEILDTYVSEREKTATELIEFDRYYTKLFNTQYRKENNISEDDFSKEFVKAGLYTTGLGTQYLPSTLTAPSDAAKSLAPGVEVGKRFPSALVMRFSDARPLQLVKAMPSDSRWNVVLFPGDLNNKQAVERFEKATVELIKTVNTFTAADKDINSVINPVVVLSTERKDLSQSQIPDFYTPYCGPRRVRCATGLHNVFTDESGPYSPHGHAYEKYGIDPSRGALIIVRPDHYISKVLALEEAGQVSTFLGGFMIPVSERALTSNNKL
ncbi:hypothetical protein jhhlp_000515 [Lomentospora prolificans]|uniref:FAD-binding domain-containing protein n=1 Tax=Lomentospora prolificans TaxID=41688 RepID=A0A2N3NL99_9PEZI|nr:hypothetical protein jhhlp_000515 [Lomentospora prolificans]